MREKTSANGENRGWFSLLGLTPVMPHFPAHHATPGIKTPQGAQGTRAESNKPGSLLSLPELHAAGQTGSPRPGLAAAAGTSLSCSRCRAGSPGTAEPRLPPALGAPVPPGAGAPAAEGALGAFSAPPGGPARPPRPAPRALRAREPGPGGDWLRGAPRGPPGRGRPPSAIHGAARPHAPSLIHKKTSFIKAAAAAAAAGPARRGRLGRCGAAAPRLCGKRRRRRRNIHLFLDYGAEGLCSETDAGSCRRRSVFFLKSWLCAWPRGRSVAAQGCSSPLGQPTMDMQRAGHLTGFMPV